MNREKLWLTVAIASTQITVLTVLGMGLWVSALKDDLEAQQVDVWTQQIKQDEVTKELIATYFAKGYRSGLEAYPEYDSTVIDLTNPYYLHDIELRTRHNLLRELKEQP